MPPRFDYIPETPIPDCNYYTLYNWTQYHFRHGNAVVTVPQRFGIGIYQISQAMEWKRELLGATDQVYECFASAALHFLGVFSMRNYTETNLLVSYNLLDIDFHVFLPEIVLLNIGKAQQMLHYLYVIEKTAQRKKRFNVIALKRSLEFLYIHCLSCIPKEKRLKALQSACSIMTGRL